MSVRFHSFVAFALAGFFEAVLASLTGCDAGTSVLFCLV